MKKAIYLLLLAAFFAANAAAQPGPPPDRGDWGPPTPEERADRLSDDLGLDADQQAKILEIFKAADEERDTLRAKHQELIRQDMCTHFKNVNEQIKSVLTDKQSSEFDDLVARKKAHFDSYRHRHHKGPSPQMECEEDGA